MELIIILFYFFQISTMDFSQTFCCSCASCLHTFANCNIDRSWSGSYSVVSLLMQNLFLIYSNISTSMKDNKTGEDGVQPRFTPSPRLPSDKNQCKVPAWAAEWNDITTVTEFRMQSTQSVNECAAGLHPCYSETCWQHALVCLHVSL